VKGVLKYPGAPPGKVLYICRAVWYIANSYSTLVLHVIRI